jgi:predicted sulfurtransferase
MTLLHKISKVITTNLKEFGKSAEVSDLEAVILDTWDEDIGEDVEGKKRAKLFTEALDELISANKIRIKTKEGKKVAEYIKKSKRGNDDNDSNNDENEEPKSKQVKVEYAPRPVATGNNTILLFYAYSKPGPMSRDGQTKAIAHCYSFLKGLNVTGRLRIGREGFNGTLTGSHDSIRKFTSELRRWDPTTFNETDFKYVDNQPDNQLLPALKVFPVTEIVTYGFNAEDAPLDKGGIHLKPKEFHQALANPNSVVIDVRNFNEALIGKFQPPENSEDGNQKYLNPNMRRSTEFPEWVDANKESWKGKQVLMYCTAGVRCERASAFMVNKGVDNVYQLDGGIHRYLEEYKEDGGYWKGKNYTFDKRFGHGADNCETISYCVHCDKPWDRYNAQQKCFKCKMEVLLCNECQRVKPALKKSDLFCPLCLPKD